MEVSNDEAERRYADGQVDVEEPTPAEVVGDPPADKRPCDGGDPEDATDANSIAYPNNETTALRLDGTQAPLDYIRVRKAIGLAIDRTAIVDVLFDGNAEAAAQLIPDGVVGFNNTLQPQRANPTQATKLIDQARADGTPVDRQITLVARNGQFPRVAETAVVVELSQNRSMIRIALLGSPHARGAGAPACAAVAPTVHPIANAVPVTRTAPKTPHAPARAMKARIRRMRHSV